MIRIIILALAVLQTSQDLHILEPEGLRDSITSLSNTSPGAVLYSVSTFGSILYSEHSTVEVLLPESKNINGCDNLSSPEGQSSKKFMWLMERGVCTYSKKAFISQQSGAFAVLVYHNDENADIANIIPCADSICEIKRQ